MRIVRASFKKKMATEIVEQLRERSDPSRWSPCCTTELQESGEGEMMAPYLMDCRRKQKLMCQQLCMLDDMMTLLTELGSPTQLINEPVPQNPGSEARARWKALKTTYQEGVQEVERQILSLMERTEQLHDKRQKLEALLSALERKEEECREKERKALKRNERAERHVSLELDDSLQTAKNALRLCEGQIARLGAEADEKLAQIDDLSSLKASLQDCVNVTQGFMQYKLVSVSRSELRLELQPRSCWHSGTELKPLQLSVTTTPDDNFHLQVFQGTAGLLEESVTCPQQHLSAALLEIMQRYLSQGEMLAEIQSLHSRFAIDWRPANRVLIFLKSASVVCYLGVDEGYPSRGGTKLLSIRKDGTQLESAALQSPVQNPRLTDWLEFLSTCPEV